MSDDSAEQNQPQAKKKFFVREIDASLLGRNSGLSKNARHLHLILRKLADAKTGAVRVSNHWFTPREISREAEMCERNRKTAMRELIDAGLAYWERERRTATVKDRLTGNLRKRHVLGLAHYFVSPIPRSDWLSSKVHTTKPNTDADSSTGQKMHRRRKPHKQRASSKVQQDTPEDDSSKVQFLHGAKNAPSILISEAPIDFTAASPLPLGSGIYSSKKAFQDSPPPPTATPTADALSNHIQEKPNSNPQATYKPAWLHPTKNASQQVLDALRSAGSSGCSIPFLADKIYRCGLERTQAAFESQGRIVQIVRGLRNKKHWPIALTGDPRARRYVLLVN